MSCKYISSKLVKCSSISSYDLTDNNEFIYNNKNYIGETNSYGSFYSTNQNIILSNQSIIFEKCNNISNIKFNNNTDYIKIVSSGVYTIHFTCLTEKPSLVGLYINNNLIKSIFGNNLIIIHEIVKIYSEDKLYFKNISSEPLITLNKPIGISIDVQNVELCISKIAPLINNICDSDSDYSI